MKRPVTQELFRAVDISSIPTRWLHMNAKELTTDRFWSWSGSRIQFDNLCGEFEWDDLKLIPVSKAA
mgnify:CR=1 FL=1